MTTKDTNGVVDTQNNFKVQDDTRLDFREENGLKVPLLSQDKPARSTGPGSNYYRRLWVHIVITCCGVLHLVATSYYLSFKTRLYIRNSGELLGTAPWLIIILITEFVYFVSSAIASVDNFLPPSKRPDLEFDGSRFPTVDILLPCCKEPTDVPEDSIRAALKMDYPSDRFRVLVLDDGGDDDLKAFCESLQAETGGRVVYLRRKKIPGVPHNFKCGNLNYGLDHSTAEYVVMMDADMILHPSFLQRLLPYIMNSPEIAFVQIPQSFYNLPLGDPLSDSSVMGYHKLLPHRDTLGCATCIGTGALFSRKHLNTIGGFQPQSITEDTTTAFALFNTGYQSVYLNEKLQIGLTPWTLEGYIKQRCRWGQGAIQQFAATWKGMLGWSSKLNIVLKFLYFWHTGYYFISFFNLLLVITMTCALVLHLKLVVGDQGENRQLIQFLAFHLLAWRLYWYALWVQVPQSIQSRCRDESHFWWMSPFYIKMIMQSLFAYSSTFKFIPTSTIDRNSAQKVESPLMKQLRQLTHVKFHLVYTLVIGGLVAFELFLGVRYYGLKDCQRTFFIVGISFFLLNTCAHMLLPVLYVVWPTSFHPSQRKSLLRYDADGVPVFVPEECKIRWYWSVVLYEIVSLSTFVYWALVVILVRSDADKQWCSRLPGGLTSPGII